VPVATTKFKQIQKGSLTSMCYDETEKGPFFLKKKKKKNYAIILFPQRRHDLGQSSCSYKCAIVRCIGLSNTFKGGEKVDEGSFSLQIYICT